MGMDLLATKTWRIQYRRVAAGLVCACSALAVGAAASAAPTPADSGSTAPTAAESTSPNPDPTASASLEPESEPTETSSSTSTPSEVPAQADLEIEHGPAESTTLESNDGDPQPLAAAMAAAAGKPIYRSVPWSSAIYQIAADDTAKAITRAEWLALGSPTVSTAVVGYQRLPWSDSVFAMLNWSQDPTKAPQQATSLSFSTWNALERPLPNTVSHIVGSSYFRWQTSTDEVYVESPDGRFHSLTFNEWRDSGGQIPAVRAGGFVRVAWSNAVWYLPSLGSPQGGMSLNEATWRAFGTPWPRTVARVPGDRFFQEWGSQEVLHRAFGSESWVTFEGWVNAGRPAPEVTYPGLFAYGTLRPGQSAWYVVAPFTYWNRNEVVAGLSMYRLPNQGYPYAVTGGSGVVGSNLAITPAQYGAAITRVDSYERYDPNQPLTYQAYYRTLRGTTIGSRSWIYLATPRQEAYVRASGEWIPSGDWLRR